MRITIEDDSGVLKNNSKVKVKIDGVKCDLVAVSASTRYFSSREDSLLEPWMPVKKGSLFYTTECTLVLESINKGA